MDYSASRIRKRIGRSVLRRLIPAPRGEGRLPLVYLSPKNHPRDRKSGPDQYESLRDEMVRLSLEGPRPDGYDEEYDVLRDAFDPAFYFTRYPDILRERLDPVAHYIRAGAREGRDPSPTFSTRGYLEATPEAAASDLTPFGHWLRSKGADLSVKEHHTTRRRLPRVFLPGTEILDPAERDAPPAHYGDRLDEMVRIARAMPRPEGYGEEYDLIRDNFDFAYYFTRYPDIFRQRIDPVAHYIRAGAREGRDPSPTFSTRGYLERNPEVKLKKLTPFGRWLENGGLESGQSAVPLKALSSMAHVLDMTEEQVETLWVTQHCNVRSRIDHGTLGEMVNRAAELEPQVALSWPKSSELRIGTFNSDLVMSRTAALHALAARAGGRRARAVVAVNKPRWGGGRRMEGYLAHALAELHGAEDVLVITTEQGGEMPPDKLPEGVRHVDVSDLYYPNAETKERVLVAFLRSLRPDIVFNVNSRTMWNIMGPYGQALSQEMAVIGCLFCAERTTFGHWTGYPIHQVYRHFDKLAAICTDSHFLAEDLRDRYAIPEDQRYKLQVLEAPVDPSIQVAAVPADRPKRRRQVFWSGRFDPQKRVDLVYAVAREMPDVDFRLWGEAVMTGAASRLPPKPDNVKLEGKYETFGELPLHEADLWFYTAGWDGVPSILLEVAMTGLPLVGSLAGGTGEVLQEKLSQGIPADADEPGAYVDAIRETLDNPMPARQRALRLRQKLTKRRTPKAYRKDVAAMCALAPKAAPMPAPAAEARPTTPAAPKTEGGIDLSLILTVHAETLVAGPTMRSADAALTRVEAAGYRVERLMGMDSVSDECRAYMTQPAFDHWQKLDFEFGDQGQSRNALVQAASGRWLAVLDADDMFSENWLEAALSRLSQPGAERTIVHPELMWQFDGSHTIYTNPAQDEPFFSPWYFAMQNYYDALCVAPRRVWLENPYVDRDVANGFAYEDWQWGVETMDAGWKHEVAPDTLIFKRRRDVSQSHESRVRRTCIRPIEPLAIDRISALGSRPDDPSAK